MRLRRPTDRSEHRLLCALGRTQPDPLQPRRSPSTCVARFRAQLRHSSLRPLLGIEQAWLKAHAWAGGTLLQCIRAQQCT